MKKWIFLILVALLACFMAACGNTEEDDTATVPSTTEAGVVEEVTVPETEETNNSEEVSSEETETLTDGAAGTETDTATDARILVAYFSYGENTELPDGVDASSSASIQMWNDDVTGNTGIVAHMIAEATNADLFSILTVEKYPDSYDATIDQGQAEKNANARPELATHIENLNDYDVIFLGFPNWWYDLPMAMYSFLEEYDFSGKTIIPFVTSGGSGFSNTISTIESLEPEANVLDGLSIGASSATGAENQVREWVAGLGYDI